MNKSFDRAIYETRVTTKVNPSFLGMVIAQEPVPQVRPAWGKIFREGKVPKPCFIQQDIITVSIPNNHPHGELACVLSGFYPLNGAIYLTKHKEWNPGSPFILAELLHLYTHCHVFRMPQPIGWQYAPGLFDIAQYADIFLRPNISKSDTVYHLTTPWWPGLFLNKSRLVHHY